MSSQPKIQGSATEWAESIDGKPINRKAAPPLPRVHVSPELKIQVEEFLYRQAEILDDKRWDDWLALFTEDGTYWVPVTEDQTVADGVPNIFYEDMDLMRVRAKRVSHPRAWSQKPPHRTLHVVSNVIVESHDQKTGDLVVRSKFHMTEFRRDNLRSFAGKYRHELTRTKDGYRIHRQRVDLVNSEGPWEYVLQTWV
ncbi:MAG: aromatic-ring-hydroxylating dioxygenase subunit beta [Candidatus Eiseniibacteriota bacterium]